MSPVQRFNSIVIALTTLIMYGTWFGIDRVIEINKGTVIITSILSGFISLGFYRGIASILSKIFNKSKTMRKFILGNRYLEGTWSGFFIGKDNNVRYICEIFEQDLENLIIRGTSYTFDEKIHGKWIAKNPVIDVADKRITYYYESDMIKNTFINPGFASFKFETIDTSSSINKLEGFSSDLYCPNKLIAFEEKMSDKKITDHMAILKQAKVIYEKYKDVLPT